MAVFPTCGFQVLLLNSGLIPGTRAEGILVLEAPEPIPRVEHIDLFIRSECVADYESNRGSRRRDIFVAPLRVELPKGEPLPRGTHRYPFGIDVPAWLPPAFEGSDCSITHMIEVRLDVDWAIDPKATFTPAVTLRPVARYGAPLVTRSAQGFHPTIVVEVTVDSSVVAQGEPVSGRVALRGGLDARFDAVTLSLCSHATITMCRGDRRRGLESTIRIPQEYLRGGESVPFMFPPVPGLPPTFRNGFIDHDVVLEVMVEIPAALDPSFEVALEVLPAGSTVWRDAGAMPVGGERLRHQAAALAQATGLQAGQLPTLVEGAIGPVGLRIVDAPRAGALGIDVDLTFPDVDLGITFRPLGRLDGFRDSPLLPPELREGYFLRVGPPGERPSADDAALVAFFAAVLDGLHTATDVRLSDHHLGMHFALANDGAEDMLRPALFVQGRAKPIADAIARLPFPRPVEAARPAWEATAREQGAFLVPHVPAIHGIVVGARVIGGEARSAGVSLRARWASDGRPGGAQIVADVDLRHAPLPRAAWAELEKGALFPNVRVMSQERAELELPWAADPRTLFPVIEAFFWWVLEQRGERRAGSAYR